jgi:multimeric flavodoxin WrbA
LSTGRASHTVQRLVLPRRSIRGCLGCETCQRALDAPGCVQRDEIAEVLEQSLGADMIVYASPVCVWGFAA